MTKCPTPCNNKEKLNESLAFLMQISDMAKISNYQRCFDIKDKER